MRPLSESMTRAAAHTRSDVHALWHALRPGVELLASDSLSVFACREPVEHELPLSEPQADSQSEEENTRGESRPAARQRQLGGVFYY